MPQAQRSSDIIEAHSEKALTYGLGGLGLLAVATILYIFRGQGALLPFTFIVAAIGIACVGYAIYCTMQVRKVTSVGVQCPYCSHTNRLTEDPVDDFSCSGCHRMIPVRDGKILRVSQVRCGYCNELNFYSDKTEVLLCESCNHEIPIAQEDGRPQKTIPRGFAVTEDDQLYEFVLIAHGPKTEELILTLQHILALNRNQVKQLLGELPATLLTGITRKKAEMLQAQLAVHEAASDFRPIAAQPQA
jgi:hypothetical protein